MWCDAQENQSTVCGKTLFPAKNKGKRIPKENTGEVAVLATLNTCIKLSSRSRLSSIVNIHSDNNRRETGAVSSKTERNSQYLDIQICQSNTDEHCHRALRGKKAPVDWEGSLNATYNLGPDFESANMIVRMKISTTNQVATIYNTIGVLTGEQEPGIDYTSSLYIRTDLLVANYTDSPSFDCDIRSLRLGR